MTKDIIAEFEAGALLNKKSQVPLEQIPEVIDALKRAKVGGVKMKTAADVTNERNASEHQRQQDAALQLVYAKYPALLRSVATSNLLVRLVSQYLGVEAGTVVVTLADFESALKANPDVFRKELRYGLTSPVETQRANVLQAIADQLTPESFEAQRFQFSGMSLDALKARLAEIKLRRQLAPHNSQEIRDAVAIARGTQGQEREPLPESWTAEKLKSASSHCLKYLLARYGSAVNDRLAGKS